MTIIAISLHNIPEGIAVYLTCLKGVESGLPLAIAMSLHNIPEVRVRASRVSSPNPNLTLT